MKIGWRLAASSYLAALPTLPITNSTELKNVLRKTQTETKTSKVASSALLLFFFLYLNKLADATCGFPPVKNDSDSPTSCALFLNLCLNISFRLGIAFPNLCLLSPRRVQVILYLSFAAYFTLRKGF